MAMAGIRITVRRVAVVLGSGVALFAVFAVINYLIPATGQFDIGSFAGNRGAGHSGGLLLRKLTSMLSSISLSPACCRPHRPGGADPAETLLVRGQGSSPRLCRRATARDDLAMTVARLRARLVRRRLRHRRACQRAAAGSAARDGPAGQRPARWPGGDQPRADGHGIPAGLHRPRPHAAGRSAWDMVIRLSYCPGRPVPGHRPDRGDPGRSGAPPRALPTWPAPNTMCRNVVVHGLVLADSEPRRRVANRATRPLRWPGSRVPASGTGRWAWIW